MPDKTTGAEVPSLNDLYPGNTTAELRQIETNLKRYVEIVWQIYYERRKAGIDRKQSAR